MALAEVITFITVRLVVKEGSSSACSSSRSGRRRRRLEATAPALERSCAPRLRKAEDGFRARPQKGLLGEVERKTSSSSGNLKSGPL